MARQIIVLSGPVAAGKSQLAVALADRFGVVRIKTQDMIRDLTNADLDRAALQKAGEGLDQKTRGAWVARELTRVLTQPAAGQPEVAEHGRVLVDSVRLATQVEAIRKAFGQRVVHVHLTAPEHELARRYELRQTRMREFASYAEMRADPTEASVDDLRQVADIVIDTLRSTPEDVVVRVASQLGFYGRSYDRLVDVLVGGEYGSEGKGQISAYLAPEYDVLVRVGGPNAGHKVYQEPQVQTFHHLPSGTTRNPAAQIVLGPGAVLYVPDLLAEVAKAEVSYERLSIDPNAMLIADEDKEEEKRLTAAIGSTGSGVGAATARKVLREIAGRRVMLAKDSPELRPYLRETLRIFDDAFAEGRRVFLEGTQGTGLSLHHGKYPYVTSRDTTVGGCLGEAGIAPGRVRRSIMVCRTYPIRVKSPTDKTSGPMSRELEWDEISRRSRIPVDELLNAEKTSTTNKQRRIGEFDWVLVRKAASLNSPTDIALSFVDYFTVDNRKARRFDQLSPETIQFIAELERVVAAPVSLIATRFAFRSIIDRRLW
jgi:adenylosuccinate synthase